MSKSGRVSGNNLLVRLSFKDNLFYWGNPPLSFLRFGTCIVYDIIERRTYHDVKQNKL